MAGYIGTTPVPQATQHRESFTATGGQTSFATVGYTPQFIDVYLNGVKLAPEDFTATNGSDVVLASGATASDILEIVAYTPFEVANQTFTGTTTAANLTVTGAFTSQGIDDNANATAITIDSSENVGIGTSSNLLSGSNRTTVSINNTDSAAIAFGVNGTREGHIYSDTSALEISSASNPMRFTAGDSERMRLDASGNLLVGKTATDSGTVGFEAAQDGHVYVTVNNTLPLYINRQSGDELLRFASNATTVGLIASNGGAISIGSDDVGVYFDAGSDRILPMNASTNAVRNDAIDLGGNPHRFKDLYLSGGVYLGGTGSANHLDDYEEGNWTPAITFDGNNAGQVYSSQGGRYVKIGNLVHVTAHLAFTNKGTSTGSARLTGLPHNIQSTNNNAAFTPIADRGQLNAGGGGVAIFLQNNVSTPTLYTYSFTGGGIANLLNTAFANNSEIDVNFSYLTT